MEVKSTILPKQGVADLFQSLNSMSKISKNSTSFTKRNSIFDQPNCIASSSENTSNGQNGFVDDYPFELLISRGSSGSSSPLTGIGRGQYMKTLEQKYSSGERRAKMDREIHEGLQEVNGSGYSNDLIEERYGFHEDTHKIASPETVQKLPETNDQFEDAIVKENRNISEPEVVVNKSIGENPGKELSSLQHRTESPGKKKRQRKIRNLVVLNHSKVNHTSSELKPPQDFLPITSTSPQKVEPWRKEEKNTNSLFHDEDFPPLA